MSLKEKINFFIDYYELDRNEWDTNYADICFLFDLLKKRVNIFLTQFISQ